MTYRLVLDVQACQSTLFRDRGVARYVTGLADALLATGRVAGLSLNPRLPPARALTDRMTTSPTLRWGTATSFRHWSDDGPVAYWVMSPFENLGREGIVPPFARSSPVVVTLFDLIPLVIPDRYLSNPGVRAAYEFRLEVVRSADLVLAISEASRADAIRLLGLDEAAVVSIGGAVDAVFRPPEPDSAPEELARAAIPSLTSPFVLCVSGADDGRKNVRGLLRAWAQLGELRSSHQLVVTCTLPDDARAAWEGAARDAGLRPGEVILTGWVPDEILVALYQSAQVCVAPSLYEGFGLPIAEAARCHTPTIAADTSSFPEVVGEREALFDPEDLEDMARLLRRALVDDEWRGRLAAAAAKQSANFEWATVARRAIDAVDARLSPPARPRRRRHRLALCGPLPPTPSGVADYTDRTVGPLAERCDVDLFVEGIRARPAERRGAALRVPLAALGSRFAPGDYDAVIHVIGSSEFHCETARLAEQVPGVVWLHDLRLGGIYITEAARNGRGLARAGREWMLREIERQYRGSVPPQLADRWHDDLAYDSFGMGMTRALVRSARAVIVNSEPARTMLLADQPADGALPPVHVIPFGVPDAPVDPPPRERDLIVVLGQVNPARMDETAVEALARLKVERPALRLVFVGPAPAGYAAELRELAESLAPGAVTITGEVPRREYEEWVSRATCAVQLRLVSRGESSASVADCIAAGTPVVTNVAACRTMADPLVHFVESTRSDAVAAAVECVLSGSGPVRPRPTPPTFDDVADALLEVVASL